VPSSLSLNKGLKLLSCEKLEPIPDEKPFENVGPPAIENDDVEGSNGINANSSFVDLVLKPKLLSPSFISKRICMHKARKNSYCKARK